MKGKLNVLISGGTGTGKTTTLNALSAFVPGDERIVTIEDAAELQLQQEHVITLESRPPNIEGQGEVRIRELVRNALRMRPDRIIVGEVRGAETLDMLQAMNTGHEGSLTTIHANSPRDALSRLETLVLTAGVDLPLRAIREQIASAFDLLVQISRLVDGSRRITHVTEVLRMESDVITLQDIFPARPPDEESAGGDTVAPLAPLQRTGLKPHFLEKLAANGVVLPPSFFDARRLGRPRAVLGDGLRGDRVSARAARGRRRSPLLVASPAAASVRLSGADSTQYPPVASTSSRPALGEGAAAVRERRAGRGPAVVEPRRAEERRARDRPLAVDGGRSRSETRSRPRGPSSPRSPPPTGSRSSPSGRRRSS